MGEEICAIRDRMVIDVENRIREPEMLSCALFWESAITKIHNWSLPLTFFWWVELGESNFHDSANHAFALLPTNGCFFELLEFSTSCRNHCPHMCKHGEHAFTKVCSSTDDLLCPTIGDDFTD